MKSPEFCENCRFVTFMFGKEYMWCRRFPPPRDKGEEDLIAPAIAGCVLVDRGGWCGEWRAREEKKWRCDWCLREYTGEDQIGAALQGARVCRVCIDKRNKSYPWSVVEDRPDPWKCWCKTFNEQEYDICWSCGAHRDPRMQGQRKKPEEQNPDKKIYTVYIDYGPISKIGAWKCRCGVLNDCSFEFCQVCGRSSPWKKEKTCYYTCKCGRGNYYHESDKLYPYLVCSCGITTDINKLYERA